MIELFFACESENSRIESAAMATSIPNSTVMEQAQLEVWCTPHMYKYGMKSWHRLQPLLPSGEILLGKERLGSSDLDAGAVDKREGIGFFNPDGDLVVAKLYGCNARDKGCQGFYCLIGCSLDSLHMHRPLLVVGSAPGKGHDQPTSATARVRSGYVSTTVDAHAVSPEPRKTRVMTTHCFWSRSCELTPRIQ